MMARIWGFGVWDGQKYQNPARHTEKKELIQWHFSNYQAVILDITTVNMVLIVRNTDGYITTKEKKQN